MTAATPSPSPDVLAAFEAAKGFMPVDEGLALYAAAAEAGALGLPLLEVGTYCGRSTILLADAARDGRGDARSPSTTTGAARSSSRAGSTTTRASVDPEVGLMDTLPDLPPHPAPGRPGGARGRARRPLPAGRGRLGRRRSAWSSSTAATPTSTRPATTRAGRRMSPRAGCW